MNPQIKKTFKVTALSAAIAAAMSVAPMAMAGGLEDLFGDQNNDPETSDIIVHKVDDMHYSSDFSVSGDFNGSGMAQAAVKDVQTQSNNAVTNDNNNNSASLSGSTLRDSSGNIQVNVAAGDGNAQDNSTSIAAIDSSFVFGTAQSVIQANQTATGNVTGNTGVHNNAGLSGNALRNAAGNIGVNAASGVNNGQKNNTAITVGNNGVAVATAGVNQNTSGNMTANTVGEMTTGSTKLANVDFDLNGTIKPDGRADQYGNIYPDSWGADSNDGDHTSGPRMGHDDWDTQTQITDINGDPITDSDQFDPSGDGGILAMNLPDSTLSGTATGSATMTTVTYRRTSNSASLSGNSLRGASGNIGVNVASGANNLQANNLSLAVTRGSGQ